MEARPSTKNLAFTVSGKNKDVRRFNEWIGRVCQGMTIEEAVMVITTNDAMLLKAHQFPGVRVGFGLGIGV